MKNLFFGIISVLLFFILFFGSLNFLLSGVPLFNLFNIRTSDAVYYLKNEDIREKNKVVFSKDLFIDKCGKTEDGFYNLAYKKDIFGFRNNKNELFYNTDVVILGDSFGISSCINHPNDLTTKLINKSGNEEILNISVAGSGPYYQKEILLSLFKKNDTKFNTLIWLFYEGNDHEDLKRHYGKKYDFNFEIKKIRNNQNIDQTKVNYIPRTSNIVLRLKLFLANYLRGFGTLTKYFKSYPVLIPNVDHYDNTVKDLNNYLIDKNIKTKIIFYIPKYTRLAYNKIKHPQLSQLNNLKSLVEITAKKYNFKFIDGSSIYRNRDNSLDVFHYNLPTHFNFKGYNVLADELTKLIKN